MNALNIRIENKIAILEFDQLDSKVNVLNTVVMLELKDILNDIAGKRDIKAVIFTSKKDGIFIAGADIKEIEGIKSTEEARKKAEQGQRIFDNLSNLSVITVAAINGACLGGGFELALACKYRTAGFSERIKIGLPEVNLGVLPGFGGTQRLPRLIGLVSSLNMILSAQIVSSQEALKYGLVDKLFPDEILLENTIKFTRDILENKAEIKKRKKKIIQRLFEDTFIGRHFIFKQAKKNVLKKTKGFYPAPLKVIEVIKQTFAGNIKNGLDIESKAFAELAVTQVSKNLIKVFYLNEEFKKFLWVRQEIKPLDVKKAAVVGAGIMGGGIAQVVSFKDIPVRLKDINYEALKNALRTASEIFSYALKRKKLKKHQVEYKLGLISPTTNYTGFKNTDLVIEAVVEDLNIKKEVFKELEENCSSKTIFVSNTSSLPIMNIGADTHCAERIAGLHFFNPVHRMPLVEVIKTNKTNDTTLAAVIDFARKIGKVVIVVNDVTGFLINRILLSYLNEAGFLLEEGMKIDEVDRIAVDFGMPMGPLELIDEIGIDVGFKVAKILESAYGERMQVANILEKAKLEGLLGKKSKLGFYNHKAEEKIPNEKLYTLIKIKPNAVISYGSAFKRLIYVMINEAARCLEENVVEKAEVVDIGMIMGTGFPPFRGGLLRYADSIGIGNICNELAYFENEFKHKRFQPAKYLINMAEKQISFYK